MGDDSIDLINLRRLVINERNVMTQACYTQPREYIIPKIKQDQYHRVYCSLHGCDFITDKVQTSDETFFLARID